MIVQLEPDFDAAKHRVYISILCLFGVFLWFLNLNPGPCTQVLYHLNQTPSPCLYSSLEEGMNGALS
jgi:hypothetical protein